MASMVDDEKWARNVTGVIWQRRSTVADPTVLVVGGSSSKRGGDVGSYREFIHPATNQQWAVARIDRELRLRIGVGKDCVERQRPYSSAQEADAALRSLIDEQLLEGFQECGPQPVEVPPNLFEALVAVGLSVERLTHAGRAGATVFIVEDSGATIQGTWRALRDRVSETGYWPVVLGDLDLELLAEDAAGVDVAAVIERADAFDLDEWISRQTAALGGAAAFSRGTPPARPSPRQWFRLHPARGEFHAPMAITRLALVPTTRAAEVVAYLGWCQDSDTDEPGWGHVSTHAVVAFLRRWNATWGAELVGLNRDSLELRVLRPCTTKAEALALAREQLAFCVDEVAQNAESLEALAELLWKAPVWHFWWD